MDLRNVTGIRYGEIYTRGTSWFKAALRYEGVWGEWMYRSTFS
jgi:hypothetical protein